MSMFDNVVFDEFTLLEGKQADEYRKRKEKEAKKAEKEDYKRTVKRNSRIVKADAKQNIKDHGVKAGLKKTAEDYNDRNFRVGADTANKTSSKHYNDLTSPDMLKNKKTLANQAKAADALRRHERRHHEQYKESAFSDIEMI